MRNREQNKPHACQQPSLPCRLLPESASAPANSPAQRSQAILQRHLDRLEQILTKPGAEVDISHTQKMLLEISDIIRSGDAGISDSQYGCILNRLANLYAGGLGQHAQDIWATTAADYADVVEAISRHHSSHDYSQSIGQLLYFMGQLFDTRKGSWHTVYRHILSMPDDIEGTQLLKKACFGEIQQWANEGVANLFDICQDLQQQLAELQDEIDTLNQRLAGLGRQQQRATAREQGQKVISLFTRRRSQEIQTLNDELRRLLDKREGRRNTIALIESNILEFENKLKESRRAYFLQAVD